MYYSNIFLKENPLLFAYIPLFILLSLVVLINYLLISNTPMFSNKSIKKQFKGNLPFIIVGIIGITATLVLKYLGLSITILSYVLLSLLVLRWKVVKL